MLSSMKTFKTNGSDAAQPPCHFCRHVFLLITQIGSIAADDTIVSLKLDFKTAREGMAVSAVWRLVYLLATHSHWNQGACQSTQAVHPARRAYGSERRAVPLS